MRHTPDSSQRAVKFCRISPKSSNQDHMRKATLRDVSSSLKANRVVLASGTLDLTDRPMPQYGPRLRLPRRLPCDSPLALQIPRRQCPFRVSPSSSVVELPLMLKGRVRSVRAVSSKLVFVDVERNGHTIQVVFNLGGMHADTATDQAKAAFRKSVRRGDWLSELARPLPTDFSNVTQLQPAILTRLAVGSLVLLQHACPSWILRPCTKSLPRWRTPRPRHENLMSTCLSILLSCRLI